MEQYFAIMFEDVRHERSLILFLSLTDPDILKQTKIIDHEINIKLSFGKLHGQNKKNCCIIIRLVLSVY